MRNVDLSAYSSQKTTRIQPEKVDLGDLPPIEHPPTEVPPMPDDRSVKSNDTPPLVETVETERDNERTSERTEIRTELRSENRSVVLPLKRRTKRYSFEFYEDQLVRLKQLKIKAEMM
jgi:hypothetical protein